MNGASTPKRVLVCGGRDYGRLDPQKILEHPRKRAEAARVPEVLTALLRELGGPFAMIHGGAKGADALADEWSRLILPTPPAIFRAAWDAVDRPGAVVKYRRDGHAYDALAGHVRNQLMIDEGKPDLVVAFPGGTGTADMISRAEKAGIEVRRIA